MKQKYYLDTSILLDYYEKRGKRGAIAFELLKKIIREDIRVVYSDLHILELKHLGYSIREIVNIFSALRLNLVKVHIYGEQKETAKKIAARRRIPKGDALHAVLTRDNEAWLITRDKHFERLKDLVSIKKPEELI